MTDPLNELDCPDYSPEAIEYKNLRDQIYVLACRMDELFYSLEKFRNDWERVVQKIFFDNSEEEKK